MNALVITTVGEWTLLRRISDGLVHLVKVGELNLGGLQMQALRSLEGRGWVERDSFGRPHMTEQGQRVLKGELPW